MQQTHYRNIAFISYKHEDEEWAKWLQRKLQYYKLPLEIRKENPDLEFSASPRYVFKDTTDLSGGVLAKEIKKGLDSSKYLIVICSPRAAKSKWVCNEVQEFIDSGREEFIIPYIIDGEPNAKDSEKECFPRALKSLAGDRVLLGININENGRDAAAVKVVARMFDISFDSLWQRFRREEKKRKQKIFAAFIFAIFVLLSIIAYGVWANRQISSERDKTNTANKYLLSANHRISKQKSELQKANDNINKQKVRLQIAYDNLSKTELALKKTNADLGQSNKKLKAEKLNVIKANRDILVQRSIEYGNLAYDCIEEGKISDAEVLLHKIIPKNDNQYVYTPEMERALRRYYNYLERSKIKLVENKELLGAWVSDTPLNLKKYGFYQPTIRYDEKDISTCKTKYTFSFRKDTLNIVVNDDKIRDFYLSESGNILFAFKDDNVYIWNINNKHFVCKDTLQDGVRDVKFLSNKRICILGKKYFSIYSYNNETLELESRTKILNRNKICNNEWQEKIPFYCDDIEKILIYQGEDSCLIAQKIGTNEIKRKKKVDGIIENIAVKHNDLPCIAFTYKKDSGLYLPYAIYNRIMILHYTSFVNLYNRLLCGTSTHKLEFSKTNYLCAFVEPEKIGVTQLYVWDVSSPLNFKREYFNLSQTLSIDVNRNNLFEDIKFITDDGCIVYGRKNKESNCYELWLFDVLLNKMEKLLTSEYSYEVDAISSFNNNYILYYQWDKGVWLYDRRKNQKKTLSSGDFLSYRGISMSPDGSTIAFRAFRKIGNSEIIVYKTKNEESKHFSLKDGFGFNLNYNGTRMMLNDCNNILHDYNLKKLSYTTISSPVGSSLINYFGYSKSGKYLYQIYCAERPNDENEKNYYIKVWTSDKHEVIMENVIEYSKNLFFDDTKNYIYRISNVDSEIIPFIPLDSLISKFKSKHSN